jgi:CelD/BcsL family acetyltransferase involved in cellulose biosynthesis
MTDLAATDAERREWDELAIASHNVFATREWLSLWWKHFGAAGSPVIERVRDADRRLVALLPLYHWRRKPFETLRFLGHGPGDELGPVHASGDGVAAARALRELLDRERWQVFVGEQLPGGWGERLGARVVRRTGSPILRIEGSWDDYLASRSSNFRQQLRRRERNLAREHTVEFRLSDDPGRLDRDLSTLFALHGARWRHGSGFTTSSRLVGFHREFAELAQQKGWLRLWILELDGRPAASLIGFRFAGVESYYQAGRDPSREHGSVGLLMLAHAIREAFAGGMSEYRFLRGDEAFKYRFATGDPGLETVALTRGLPARLALSLVDGTRRLRSGREATS